jgi:SAM-dependent methyltransferase
MTVSANESQFDAWNGESGRRWVTTADSRDRVLAPVGEALLGAAAATPGMRVLDVGCGCGSTTLMAARSVGSTGSATGIDLSGPMLDVARQRASAAVALNASFVQGDAQTHAFERDAVDLVISRFGTMFFADAEAAFANIARALRADGRLCLATWQPLAANEWLMVPGAVLLRHTDLPATVPDQPGMFAQSDPEQVSATLAAAGFVDIAVDGANVTFTFGQTIDEAVDFLADGGPGRMLLETIPEGTARDAALADVHEALTQHHDSSGVRLGGAIWLITANRSRHQR